MRSIPRVPLIAAVVIVLLAASAPAAQASRMAASATPAAGLIHTTTGQTPPASVVKYYASSAGRRAARSVAGEHVIAGVPTYTWRHGCAPTATGMVVGFWDSHGYDQLIPGDNSSQTDAALEAIASDTGLNGGPGHYEDYSAPRDDSGPVLPDKSAPPAGDEHASNSIADFEHTSWSADGLTYGSTYINKVGPGFVAYVEYAQPSCSATSADYWVGSPASTTTWGVIKTEVDAGRPMVLSVDCTGDGEVDHAITCVGYRESSGYPEYAYYNTWDHTMYWAQYRPPSNAYKWGVYMVTALAVSGGGDPVPPPAPDPVPDPTPTVSALDPTAVVAGGPGFTLSVSGSQFISGASGAVVEWNGADLVTTRDSARGLTAAVPASMIAAAGTVTIAVRNGTAASAPLSNAVSFTIRDAPPQVTSVAPGTVWAGCVKPGMVLTVNGANFLSGAQVLLGSHAAAATYVSATRLIVPLTPADVAASGTIDVGVRNPAPSGSESATTVPLVVMPETSDPTVSIEGADSDWHNVPVPLAFTATDGQSGVQGLTYQSPPAVVSWVSGSSYTVPVDTQGEIIVSTRATDWCGHTGSTTATVRIDTTKPTTAALNAVSVGRNKTAKLKFQIGEPAGLSPSASVVLEVKAAKGGAVLKTIPLGDVPVNALRTASLRATLRRGSYRWYVYATDLAGNPQANIAWASFTVK